MDSKLSGLARVRHLAQLGLWGVENAIKKLELDSFEVTQLPEIIEMESSTLKRCLNIASKAFVTGMKLGLNCLEQSAKNLIAFSNFIQLNEFNATEKPDIDKDTLTKMSFVCKDTVPWLLKIGEDKSSEAVTLLTWYTEKLANARRGDQETLRLLELSRMPSVNIKPIEGKPSHLDLQVEYNRANEIATAASYMGNRILRTVNQLTMAVTTLMAKTYYPKQKVLSSRVDGRDMCQTVASEIQEIKQWLDFLKDSRKAEQFQDPKDVEEELRDPSYEPHSSSEDNSDEEEDESEKPEKVAEEKKKPGKIHVKYEKNIAITKDGLLSDYKFAAMSYLCARELGIKALKQTSSLAIKYMTQVGKSEFSLDLKADKQLNAIEATKKTASGGAEVQPRRNHR